MNGNGPPTCVEDGRSLGVVQFAAPSSMEMAIMTWVDFQAVQENLEVLVLVLAKYGLDVKQNEQDQVKFCCPFHNYKDPSCGLNTKKRVFDRDSCGEKSNILDLIARTEGFDPDRPPLLRTAALYPI